MWHMHDAGWGLWLLMSVGMIVFWALVIYGVVWLVRGMTSERSGPADPEPPSEVLRRRLAEGKITLEEYERLRVALARDAPGARESAPR